MYTFLLMDNFIYKKMLEPVIAGILWLNLKEVCYQCCPLIWQVGSVTCGTIAYIKTDAIDHVLSILNSFHGDISFTYKQETNGKISFLDILILRSGNSFKTTINRKPTHNDIYFQGESFVPNAWKRETEH